MDIVVRGNGLHKSETNALSKMEQTFSKVWFAYASVVLADDQGSMELDVVIVTHDRVLLVELKEWNGVLTSQNGNWFINGKYRSRSPYDIKRVHGIRLSKILRAELNHLLGYTPKVDVHVVLCGTATPENLTNSDRRYVHTLQDFLTICNNDDYNRLTSTLHPNPFTGGGARDRPTSERCRQIFNKFFCGGQVQRADFTYRDFVAAPHPDRVHGQRLFSEYPSVHSDNQNSLAMMRRWDLGVLGLRFHDTETWCKVVMREEQLYRTAASTNSPLEQFLLRPVFPIIEEDVHSDCVELYELRRNTRRLAEHISLDGAKWTAERRLDLARAVLTPFAELHSQGMAHRDIDTQNLWFSADHDLVLTSSYQAAFFPEKGTVKDVSDILRSGDVKLPEDVYGTTGDVDSPFSRDVYLLALVLHQICFHNVRLHHEDGVAVWRKVDHDPFAGKLDTFFERAMDIEQQGRFDDARTMLAEFNTITQEQHQRYDDSKEVLDDITNGDFIKSHLSPFALLQAFPPAPGVQPDMMGDKISYRCIFEGQDALFKFWAKAVVDPKSPGMNRRISQMRKRIVQMKALDLPVPTLLSYGMFYGGNGLFVVTKYVDGQDWSVYIETLSETSSRISACLALCNAVQALHTQHIAHGDLHPGNILVAHSDTAAPTLTLIDVLDFGDSSTPYNVEYGPKNPSATDGFGRDRFAVYKLVMEVLGDSAPSIVREELERGAQQPHNIPVALHPLISSLNSVSSAHKAPVTSQQEALIFSNVTYRFPAQETPLQPEGLPYYLGVAPSRKNPGKLYCRITARDKQIVFDLDAESKSIENLKLYEISMADYVSASTRADCTFTEVVKFVRGQPTREIPKAIAALIDDLEIVPGTQAVVEHEDTSSSSVRPRAVWSAFLETEDELRHKATVLPGELQETPAGAFLIPCKVEAETLREILGEDENEIGVYFDGETRAFGYAVGEDSNSNILAVMIDPRVKSVRKKLTPGTELILESKSNNASRNRREKAMNRILAGGALIPHLPDYFDIEKEPSTLAYMDMPGEAEIRQRYDTASEQLNSRQIEAFRRTISSGPVCVLQGPPGTGKTAFVSKFIHYLFENELAKNVLLVGQSHTSVDTVAIKTRELCENLGTPLSVVRLGSEDAIDDKLLQCHSSSIQRQIRNKFQREYEIRINAIASRLPLSKPLIEELAKLHRSIGPLLQRIRSLAMQHDSAKHTQEHDDETSVVIEQNIQECLDTLSRHLSTRGYEYTLPSPMSADFWPELSTQVARSHGVTNQLALQRLNNLISISQDWLDVLASGAANYDKFLVKTSQLVCGTLVGIGAGALRIEELEFDWVIVDEAARAQASELMIALQCARRVLLVGDHKQLPPLYNQKHVRSVARRLSIEEKEAIRTDFERAFIANNGITFDTQYRMIQPIGAIVSHCFYNNELKSPRKEADDWYAKLPYPLCKPVTWIDSGSGQRAIMEDKPSNDVTYNTHEIQLCLHLCRQLAQPEHLAMLKQEMSDKHPHPIGIITMYGAQKQRIEEELSRAEWATQIRSLIRIDTVDSYQGQENKIIILSLVRNNPTRNQGFLVHPSRINVALSRAQNRLVVIGAQRMWGLDNCKSPVGEVLQFITDQFKSNSDNYEIVDGTTVIEGHLHAL